MQKLERYILKNQQMSVNAGTVLKVLGKPPINWSDVIVRESIQNSLDAAQNQITNKITFEINILKVENTNLLIDNLFFLKQEENDLLFKRLADRIRLGDPAILILKDSGTTGLSGPIRRDDKEWDLNNERKNFDNLVYQLGINHGTSGSGGSYGFGKSSYYHLNQSGLVMYYSRSKEGQRIAFSMISEREHKEEIASTGICWWGENYFYNGIEYAAPITDEIRINEILSSLNLNDIAYKVDEFGTLIAIIAPDLNKLTDISNIDEIEEDLNSNEKDNNAKFEEKINKVNEVIKKCILKWYWPRIYETHENNENGIIKPLVVILNDHKITLPPPLIEMGKLLEAAEYSNTNEINKEEVDFKVEKINHKFGNVLIGSLAYRKINISSSEKSDYFNKIAMIREPRMVVYYQDVQKKIDITTISVFLVNSNFKAKSYANDLNLQKLDNAFRDSESATHSEWNYQIFDESKKWFRGYVKKAKEETIRIINNSLIDTEPLINSKTLGVIAKNLGKLLSSEAPGGMKIIKNGGLQNSANNNNKERKIKVISAATEFEDENIMTINILLGNYEFNVSYKMTLLAKSTSEALSQTEWQRQLGGGFPFKLLSAYSKDFNLNLKKTENIIDFILENNEIKQANILLKIQVEKMDSLISFEINKS